jgi:ATP-dependent Clp protease ATP-binding subunit ClpA
MDRFGSVALLRHEIRVRCHPAEGERYSLSPEAQQVLRHATEEATLPGHQSLGTGHLLLGLLRVEDSFPAQYLRGLGMELASTRTALIRADLPNNRPAGK